MHEEQVENKHKRKYKSWLRADILQSLKITIYIDMLLRTINLKVICKYVVFFIKKETPMSIRRQFRIKSKRKHQWTRNNV